jgi:hypothetical protein
MANEIGIENYEREMKVKDKRRACVTKFATSRKHNTYLKMLLKHLLAGELCQVSTKKLKLAVDTMLLDA